MIQPQKSVQCCQKKSSFISKEERAKRVKMAAEYSMNSVFSVPLFLFSILMKNLRFSFLLLQKSRNMTSIFYAEYLFPMMV